MTMRLALGSATVSPPGAPDLERVQVLSRGGRFTVRTRAGEVLYDVAATGVAPAGPKRWLAQTELGEFVIVRKAGDCGCGGAR